MYLVMFHKNWKSFLRNIAVTSLAEVWIETPCYGWTLTRCGVTSLAEVWIETGTEANLYRPDTVTSLAEVWIETM